MVIAMTIKVIITLKVVIVMQSCHTSKRGNSQELRGQKRGIFVNIKGQIRGKIKEQLLI